MGTVELALKQEYTKVAHLVMCALPTVKYAQAGPHVQRATQDIFGILRAWLVRFALPTAQPVLVHFRTNARHAHLQICTHRL